MGETMYVTGTASDDGASLATALAAVSKTRGGKKGVCMVPSVEMCL